jgi:hypothetical protein
MLHAIKIIFNRNPNRLFQKIKAHTNLREGLYALNHKADIQAKLALSCNNIINTLTIPSPFTNPIIQNSQIMDANVKTIISSKYIQKCFDLTWSKKKWEFLEDINWKLSFTIFSTMNIQSTVYTFALRVLYNILPTLHMIKNRNKGIIPEWEICPLCTKDIESTNHIFIYCDSNDDLKTKLKEWAVLHSPEETDEQVIKCALNKWIPTNNETKSTYSPETAPWYRGFSSMKFTQHFQKSTSISSWITLLQNKCIKQAYKIWIRRCNWIRDNGLLWENYSHWAQEWMYNNDTEDFPYDILQGSDFPITPTSHTEHSQ